MVVKVVIEILIYENQVFFIQMIKYKNQAYFTTYMYEHYALLFQT
jgi:hypothetical protein